ncbi:hypothetical protein PInf_024340 [Phytophthora infestans]|nr:hypothetical protein PInf_024340 [Phytophthora infestans]
MRQVRDVSAVFTTLLSPRFISSFKVMGKKSLTYKLNLAKKMRTHLTFYVSLPKPCQDSATGSTDALALGRKVMKPHIAEISARDEGTSEAKRAAERRDAPDLIPAHGSLDEAEL